MSSQPSTPLNQSSQASIHFKQSQDHHHLIKQAWKSHLNLKSLVVFLTSLSFMMVSINRYGAPFTWSIATHHLNSHLPPDFIYTHTSTFQNLILPIPKTLDQRRFLVRDWS